VSSEPKTLFDLRTRDDPSPAAAAEDSFSFLNRVDSPYWQQIRDVLDEWFGRYPMGGRVALRNAFRSPDTGQHWAGWWELYLHELFRCLGYAIELHPSIEGTKRTPDFLLKRDSSTLYVEATVVFSGINAADAAGDAPAWLLDAINKIEEPRFFVVPVEVTPGPERLKVRQVTVPLEAWLRTLDPDQATSEAGDGRGLPQTTVECRGWEITYEAWPVKPEARGLSDHKTLGGGHVVAGWVDDIEQLVSKLKTKAGRYGRPEAPLVTAVLCASSFMKDLDLEQALFGREAFLIPPGADNEPTAIRQRNGFWMWSNGPQNKRVSAVLTAVQLHPWTAAATAPKLWLNPWADHPLNESWPFASATAAESGEPIHQAREPAMHTLLGLPDGWPVGQPFPRSG
jgi:hypothetical protein